MGGLGFSGKHGGILIVTDVASLVNNSPEMVVIPFEESVGWTPSSVRCVKRFPGRTRASNLENGITTL